MASTSPANLVPKRQQSSASTRSQISAANETTFKHANRLICLAVEVRVGLESRTHDRRWRNLKIYPNCFLHSDAVDWMSEYLQDHPPEHTSGLESSEELAVSQLNQLVDAGYIHHVCNEHRFVVGETETLFFCFQDDTINVDMRSIKRRKELLGELYGGVSSVISEETAQMKLAIERLTTNMENHNHLLDDAHGRIMILEEVISALVFALKSLVYLFSAYALYCSLTSGDREVASLVFIGFNFALLLFGTICFFLRGPQYVYNSMIEHVAALFRLICLGDDVEGAFMADIDESSMETSLEDTSLSSQNTSTTMATNALGRNRSILKGIPELLQSQLVVVARDYQSLPPLEDWPHRPVLVCANTDAHPDLNIPMHGCGPVPLGKPFKFRSDLFEGTCLIRLRDVPTDDPISDAEYFLGRRRKFQAIVQGKFKEPLRVSDVLTGHEFSRPLKGLSPMWVVSAGCNLIKRLSPGVKITIHGNQPKALAILAGTAQLISADMPGNEPDITCNQIDEDISLFGGIFKSGNVSTARRKRHMASPSRAEKYAYDTESIYTFDFYQNILNTADYSLDLGFTKIGIGKILDGQPIQVLGKTKDGRNLWNFQVWHEKLLPKSEVRKKNKND